MMSSAIAIVAAAVIGLGFGTTGWIAVALSMRTARRLKEVGSVWQFKEDPRDRPFKEVGRVDLAGQLRLVAGAFAFMALVDVGGYFVIRTFVPMDDTWWSTVAGIIVGGGLIELAFRAGRSGRVTVKIAEEKPSVDIERYRPPPPFPA